MPTLQKIVDVQISRGTRTPAQAGFGVPLFLGLNGGWSERVKKFTGMDVVADEFASSDPEYKMAQAAFSQSPRPPLLMIGRKTGGESWVDALDDIVEEENGWYGLALTTRTKADILATAAWVQAATARKLYIASSADPDIMTTSTSDLASMAKASAYSRTAIAFHKSAETVWFDAGWLGKMLPKEPGSATWGLKGLEGVPADVLTPTQSENVLGKSANTYETTAALNMTFDGKTSGPEWIDVIRDVDFMEARMGERIFGFLASQDKVPMTDPGVTSVESLVREQLDIAVRKGIITSDYTISAPLVKDIPIEDRNNRHLPDLNFSATLAGAIQSTTIRGTVSV